MNGRSLFDRLVHDLKGPLSPLQTAAYLLRRPDLQEGRRVELAETVERQSRRMASMIEELGDWVRAGEGRLVTRMQPVDVQMAMDLAAGGINGCAIAPELADDLVDARVQGDENRLVQALCALLTHARSRDAAPPRLRAYRRGDRVLIEVSDAGPAPDDAAALLTAPLPEPYDLALGLRLVIAAAIAQAHGGRLEAQALAPGLLYRLELPLLPG